MMKKGRAWFYDTVEEAKDHAYSVLGFEPTTRSKDLSGETFGYMRVLCPVGKRRGKSTYYVSTCLKCLSGKLFIRWGQDLKVTGRTCGCSRVNDEEIAKELAKLGWKVLGRGGKTVKTKWELKCRAGHIRRIKPWSILGQGNGCQECSEYGFKQKAPAHFYIQELSNKDKVFLKFGVTNHAPIKRLKQQSRKSSFTHRIIHSFYSENGKTILDLETAVKQRIPTGVVPKELLPDGYTETTEITNLGTILMIIKENLTGTSGGTY